MEIQLKAGDDFLRISKYGKVFGIVKSINTTSVISENCDYQKLIVESTNGINYDYSECHKVIKKLNVEEIEKRKKLFSSIKILSERKSNAISF